MTNYTHEPYERNIITAENIEAAREAIPPLDQCEELEVGCETWGILYAGGQRGQMTRWPNGRGAIFLGGDSEWGDWETRDGEDVLVVEFDGDETVYDDHGHAV